MMKPAARKFYLLSYNGNFTVFEQVKGGARAVSKRLFTKEEGLAALAAKRAKG